MNQEAAFTANGTLHDIMAAKVKALAGFIEEWFAQGVAVVGLNEIHESIVSILELELHERAALLYGRSALGAVKVIWHETNALVWRTP
jgi:hypothetical protein